MHIKSFLIFMYNETKLNKMYVLDNINLIKLIVIYVFIYLSFSLPSVKVVNDYKTLLVTYVKNKKNKTLLF